MGSEMCIRDRITPNLEGLLHISEIAHKRIDKVEDYIRVGDKVRVKIIGVEPDTGKVRLSRKALIDKSERDNGKYSGRKNNYK